MCLNTTAPVEVPPQSTPSTRLTCRGHRSLGRRTRLEVQTDRHTYPGTDLRSNWFVRVLLVLLLLLVLLETGRQLGFSHARQRKQEGGIGRGNLAFVRRTRRVSSRGSAAQLQPLEQKIGCSFPLNGRTVEGPDDLGQGEGACVPPPPTPPPSCSRLEVPEVTEGCSLDWCGGWLPVSCRLLLSQGHSLWQNGERNDGFD